MSSLQILIADDHEAIREGARAIIERETDWKICGTASTGREALDLARDLQPDILVLDLTLPELNGLDVLRRIKRVLPQTEVVIFTAHADEQSIHEAFAAGARSFVSKPEPLSSLTDAIRSAAEHKPFFTKTVSDILFSRFNDGNPHEPSLLGQSLSTREREILQMLADGKSNKEVASALEISVRTVEAHRASLFRKLGIDSIAELVRYAIRNHLIDP
jgi:DNA-binding NarL/FixJ family response regulator